VSDPVLDPPVDPARDHVRGDPRAPVTLVQYGDYECPSTAEAAPIVRALLRRHPHRVRFAFRHLPLDVHPRAIPAAEAAEAAGAQGAYWRMHDLLLERQLELSDDDLRAYAAELGLDVPRFGSELVSGTHRARVLEDRESAVRSGAGRTPTFFVGARRHTGFYDLESLSDAVLDAP
jgi:Na+:H+ antiporter, NhaA family